MKISDLKPAPYNPRVVTDEALGALQTSLGEFGDISGIVWNKKTGHLVAGHQRLEALKRKHGNKLALRGGEVVTPSGERYPVRVVDWPVEREKAANLAANSPLLAGSFDPGRLEAVLADLNTAEGLADLLDGLRLGELLPGAGDLLPETATGETGPTDGETAVDVPAGPTEWITFSVPLSAAQHKTVMDAVRLAKAKGCEKVSDCLYAIALAYVKEHEDE
jgi:hypothetical protein